MAHRTSVVRVRAIGLGVIALALLVLPACRSGGSHQTSPASTATPPVVVASFNFSESVVLAELYAQALEAAKIPVRREINLGPREVVQPAMRQGLVDVVPEYAGSALGSIDASAVTSSLDTAEAAAMLASDVAAWNLRVLNPAAAQDQNGFAVTRATADRLHLKTVSDLAPVSGGMALTGPTECPGRPFCGVGLEKVYGIRFARFVAYDGESQRATALVDGVAGVAVLFTTDANLANGDLVMLDDDRHLQPPENVVPIVSSRALSAYGSRLADALNAVSARLTTAGLVFLNWRVEVAGKDPAKEAAGWLKRAGLTRAAG